MLQFRKHNRAPPGWDLSCQRVEGKHIAFIEPQLDRASMYKNLGEGKRFLIDLSLNELQTADLKPLMDLLRKNKDIDISVADNCFDWATWLQANCPEDGLRLVKTGRLSMASTVNHTLTEKVLVAQAETEQNLAKATETIASMATANKDVSKWRKHVDFGLEDEVNIAFEMALIDRGYTDVQRLQLNSIKGPDGKDAYSFNGVFEGTLADKKILFVGEVKQYLEGHDVRDAEADRQKLCKRLASIKAGSSEQGKSSYYSQTRQLEVYINYDVKLYVGSARVMPDAIQKAEEVNAVVVRPDGGRIQAYYL